MNTKPVFAFILGSAIGSFVTWKLVKGKYEQISREEIQSVKDAFYKREHKPKHDEKNDEKYEAAVAARHKANLNEYAKILNEEGYSSDDKEENNDEKGGEDPMTERGPYTIRPEELGNGGYNVMTLNYYEDDVIADDWDVIIDNSDELLGEDIASHFGEYEDDIVCVRNDKEEMDYEISRVIACYWDTVGEDLLHQDDDE